MQMWQWIRVPVSKWWNMTGVLKCPFVRDFSRAELTCSSRYSSDLETAYQASTMNVRYLVRISFLSKSPTLILWSPIFKFPIIPIILATFPHPVFLLSSIVAWFPPLKVIIFPSYLICLTPGILFICLYLIEVLHSSGYRFYVTWAKISS